MITGAGKGIGKSVAELILKNPSRLGSPKLVLTSRTESDLLDLKKMAGNTVPCEILPLDLAQNPTAPVEFAVQKFGKIDQVIHSAGVGRFGHFQRLTREDLEFTMKTNVEASFLFLQSAYGQIKSQAPTTADPQYRGDLIWITSVAADRPFEQSAIYCMSKYAQKGLIEVMRLYGRKDGIRILDVKPGATLTPMWGQVPTEMESKMMKAEDVAQAIVDAMTLSPRASIEELVIRPIAGDL